ncbi:GntR family transcriptional regulator [Halomonas cupida]|uniref:Transcriptional regulator n=1 Tax=Halomonas cupida TaxID=44933 RepID=A0A1M7MEN2_9GAMM|nr:GntR family transcriptional regulator [Halomonas cupida]GEN25775.1 transcriptional regulator [Halomonas cupida]SHM89274.1 transcriptional regulator, GntR family [Halomonas cupida]
MDPRFERLKLDASLATPLYLQLARQLELEIRSGEWRAGEALPSERNLAEALSVSRITARNALDQLAESGLIRRDRGSGTFIRPSVNQSLTRLVSFSEMLTRRGFTPRSEWLLRDMDWPSSEESLRLGLSANAQVARLKRLRLADDVVMAVEESCLPVSVLPEPQSVETSLYKWLEAAGRPITRALQHVTAINADENLARLADVPAGQALLKITRVGYLADDTPAELTVTYCRTDYYDFTVELAR